MINRLDGLRHDAVVTGHHQYDNVGHGRAAGAHRGEGFVARRIEERDFAARRHGDLVSTDVLRDAAGFARHHVRCAQCIQQGGLAVINVTHDRDDWRARHKIGGVIIVGPSTEPDLDIGGGNAIRRMTKLGDDDFGGLGIDGLIHRRHHTHFHERTDDIDGALSHAVRQFLDSNVVGNGDFAEDFLRRL